MSAIQQCAPGAYFPLSKQRSAKNQQLVITHCIKVRLPTAKYRSVQWFNT